MFARTPNKLLQCKILVAVLSIESALMAQCGVLLAATEVSSLSYTYPVANIKEGHSYGNAFCYVTLNGRTDIPSDRSTARHGLRESTDQKYYLLGWQVEVVANGGDPLQAVRTTFTPAYQESELGEGQETIHKRFFLPFENNYLRAAHFLLRAEDSHQQDLVIRSRVLLPSGAKIEESDDNGFRYLTIRYPGGAMAALWGSGGLRSFDVGETDSVGKQFGDLGAAGGFEPNPEKDVLLTTHFKWTPSATGPEYGLSFVYTLDTTAAAKGYLRNALINGEISGTPQIKDHIFRLHQIRAESELAIDRYLTKARLWTPDPIIDRALQWAKVNQLRLQQEAGRGASFTNDPPSDITVGRDSVWYLMGSSYYSQVRSRKLLDAWLRYGLEPSGKFIEYFTAARDPIYRDDYGLNIADNTPLMIMAAHHYFSLTGDRAFLEASYPSLLNSGSYILEQMQVGDNNHFGLVWCTSTDTFVRGLPVWRNAIPKCNISGAPTELNAECYQAFLLLAELAAAVGDEANSLKFRSAAARLRNLIEVHLRSNSVSNPFYLLNITPDGQASDDLTGDVVFPALCGVSTPSVSKALLNELFSERFWASTNDGAGGIRAVSSRQGGRWGYQAKALPPGSDPNWNYGLLGGVWPNLAMWAARAAAAQGMADLSLKALSATFRLNEREDPAAYNVVPGEFNGYCNGDDLRQKEMPLSPFLPGIFIWSSIGSFMGVSPHANGLEVDPNFPKDWNWVAVSNLPYRGHKLTMVALRDTGTLYSTVPVRSKLKQVAVPESLQERFAFEAGRPAFWIVIPAATGYAIFAGSSIGTSGDFVDLHTGRVLMPLSIPAGKLVEVQLPKLR